MPNMPNFNLIGNFCCYQYSVGYTMDIMYFSWIHQPVEIDKNIQLPQFKLRDYILYDCSQNYTGGKITIYNIQYTTPMYFIKYSSAESTELFMIDHIKKLPRSCFIQLRQLRTIRRSLSEEVTLTPTIHAFVVSRREQQRQRQRQQQQQQRQQQQHHHQQQQ